MSARRFPFSFDEAADVAEARARADAMDISSRLEEAVAMHLLAIHEIARRAKDVDELYAMLDREPPGCPYDRWKELQARDVWQIHERPCRRARTYELSRSPLADRGDQSARTERRSMRQPLDVRRQRSS
jgi:hypothetical protein